MRPLNRVLLPFLALVLAAAPATAEPGARDRARDGGRGGETGGGRGGPERRERMLHRAHTLMVMELGERLSLDSAATIRLAERLKRFDDQRVALRLENFTAVKELRAIADGGPGDAVAVVRKVTANRVKLAQVDEAELAEILQGLPADKAAKVALFVGEFTNRLERVAQEAVRERRGGQRGDSGGFDEE